MTVRDLVAGEVIRVGERQTLREAVRKMHESGIGALAVETDGRLVGVITERDIVAACDAGTDFDGSRVDAWMTPYPDAFTPEMTVDDAASWMLATGFRHLPVVDGDEMVGMISIKDVLWAVTEPPGR